MRSVVFLLSHLQVSFLLLSVQLERLLELKAEAGHVVDVGPAMVGHHVHPGHHADGLGDGDVGAGVDQLAWEGEEDKRYGLCSFSRDKICTRTLLDGVDTGPDVLPVCWSVGLTLTRAESHLPQSWGHLPSPDCPLRTPNFAAC